jgi:DUF1365 family protein
MLIFAAICFIACTGLKNALGYDDSLDVFGIHCIGGIVGAIGTGMRLPARKVFHVSPFFPVDGEYGFRFHEDEGRCLFRIDYERAGLPQLNTSLSGQAAPLTDARLLPAFLRLPWLMVGVIARIHLQALRLWWKGAVFHRKPLPPVETTTR